MASGDSASEFKQQFMARVKAAREARSLSQEKIATVLNLGVSDPQGKYKQYESRSLMPHHIIPIFCMVTGVSIEWLYTGKGNGVRMPPPQEPAKPSPRRKKRAA